MNARIRELAEQSTDKWVGGEFFDREKFAELIVLMCAEVADNHFESKEPGYPGDAIQKHFNG